MERVGYDGRLICNAATTNPTATNVLTCDCDLLSLLCVSSSVVADGPTLTDYYNARSTTQ